MSKKQKTAEEEMKSKIFSDLGKKGGKKTLEKYGKTHFSEMNRKRWAAKKAKKSESKSK